MLLPDNVHPENTVYFNAAFVLQSLQTGGADDMVELYLMTNRAREMSFSLFTLCLDWLYLSGAITTDSSDGIKLCS